jgi:hypothetical protein
MARLTCRYTACAALLALFTLGCRKQDSVIPVGAVVEGDVEKIPKPQEPEQANARGVDWARAEDAWFNAMRRGLVEVADKHSHEEFYGAFFDCNSYYIGFQVHLNTEAGLREKAKEYRMKHASLYPGWSVEQLMEHLRWSGGDWKYFEALTLPSSPEVDLMHKQLTRSRDESREADVWQDFEERYMEMCCRVVIRLDKSGVFEEYRRTSDFRFVCVEEDESFQAGEDRLNRIRGSFRSKNQN